MDPISPLTRSGEHAMTSFVASKRSIAMLASACLLAAATNSTAVAQTTLASATFASFANGNLVGQNGWLQYNTQSTNPIQVINGVVGWVGSGTASVNDQDAMLPFSQQLTQPASGTNVINFDMLLRIGSAGSSPSYFAALNTLTGTTTTSNFQNARVVAQASGTGFVFGARVNGQSGYPFGYGTTVLNFNQYYALRAEINQVAGNSNDFITMYVGPDFGSLTLYGTAGYSAGTVADPDFGANLLSQFSSPAAFGSTVTIQNTSVGFTLVPEPSTLALGGFGLAAAGWLIRRRTRPAA